MSGQAGAFRLDGAELAGYRVRSLIGRGGMAYVYRAEDPRLGRTVALKVLAPEVAEDRVFRRRFLIESQTAASLDHPNIIPVYDAGESDGRLYIVMRYVEGRDFKAVLEGGQPLDDARVLNILAQTAAALDHAHARGLVHRDVKPANILIAQSSGLRGQDHVYLSDFGVAIHAVATASDMTADGALVGTMDYLAPEQISDGQLDARTDEYALGCVAFQALTRSLPFVRDSDAALLWAHVADALPDICALRPDLPAAVQDVVATAMAKRPANRYPTCGEFVAALESAMGGGRRARSQPLLPVAPSQPLPVTPPSDPEAAPRHLTVVRSTRRPADTAVRAAPAGPTPPPEGAPSRARPLKALAAAAVLLLSVAGLVAAVNHELPTRRFSANAQVPASLDYPTTWGQVAAGTRGVMVSPHATELAGLCTTPLEPGVWAATSQVLRRDLWGAVGACVFVSDLPYRNAAVQPATLARQLLPGTARLTAGPEQSTLDGTPALRLDGVLSDPAHPATELRFRWYIVPTATDSGSLHLVLFSAPAYVARNKATFDRIAASVDLAR